MYNHAGTMDDHKKVTYFMQLLIAVAQRSERKRLRLLWVSNLYLSFMLRCDAIDVCHVASMNPLFLTDYALLIIMEV